MRQTPLDEALDPTTSADRLSALASDQYAAEVRRAAHRNPNLEPSLLSLLLETNDPDAWANPTTAFVLIEDPQGYRTYAPATVVGAVQDKRVDLAAALREHLEALMDAWWRAPATTPGARGDHMVQLAEGAGRGTVEHRRAVRLFHRTVARVVAAYSEREGEDDLWAQKAAKALDQIDQWLEGERVDLSALRYDLQKPSFPMGRAELRFGNVMPAAQKLVALVQLDPRRVPLYSSLIEDSRFGSADPSALAPATLNQLFLDPFPSYPWPPSLTP